MGIGPKKGTFIAPERKKLTNMFIPNKRKRSLMRSCEAKIFCGSFTRDGNLFITGSQGMQLFNANFVWEYIKVCDFFLCIYRFNDSCI